MILHSPEVACAGPIWQNCCDTYRAFFDRPSAEGGSSAETWSSLILTLLLIKSSAIYSHKFEMRWAFVGRAVAIKTHWDPAQKEMEINALPSISFYILTSLLILSNLKGGTMLCSPRIFGAGPLNKFVPHMGDWRDKAQRYKRRGATGKLANLTHCKIIIYPHQI